MPRGFDRFAPQLGTVLSNRIPMRWESRSSCKISRTLSCAGRFPCNWSTSSAVGRVRGAFRSADREPLTIGIYELKGQMDWSAVIVCPVLLRNMSRQRSAQSL